MPYVCERRQEAVVLHPGSHSLKLGMATDDLPVVVPHLVARRLYGVRRPLDPSVAAGDVIMLAAGCCCFKG
jgi:actin-related protein